MPRMVFRWDLTPHERAALLTVLSDYITNARSVEVSIDAATGEELPVADLLTRLMLIDPISAEE